MAAKSTRNGHSRLRGIGAALLVASVLSSALLGIVYGWNGSIDFDELRNLAILFAILAVPGLLVVVYTFNHKLRLITVAVLLAIIALGYVSANQSILECENRTARQLAENHSFWILRNDHTEEACKIFARVRADFQICRRPSVQFPWRLVNPGRTKMPFVVAVEYGWVEEPQVGQGGQKVYFCLFGYCIEVSDAITWVT